MMENDFEKTAIGAFDTGEATQMGVPQMSNATQYAANVECPVCKTANPPSEMYCIDCGFLLSSAPVGVEDAPEVKSYGKMVASDGTREFALKPGENSVGREAADVLLGHGTVSRKHAKITVENGKAYVEDLGSTNGTTLDGRKLAPGEKAEMADGAEVVFGSAALKYVAPEVVEEVEQVEDAEVEVTEMAMEAACEVVETGEAVEVEEAAEEAEPEPAVVGSLVSQDGSTCFELRPGTYTIGRRQGANDIVIPDPYCSGRHADLSVEDGKFTLTDVGSTNGTQVNGVKLEANTPRAVVPGDEITFGQAVFTIEVA